MTKFILFNRSTVVVNSIIPIPRPIQLRLYIFQKHKFGNRLTKFPRNFVKFTKIGRTIELVISKKTEQIHRAPAQMKAVNQISPYLSSAVGFKQFMTFVEILLEHFQKER